MVVYVTLIHYWSYLGLMKLPGAPWQTKLFAFVLWPVSGLGITAGAHRLWSHRSYKAGLPYRIALMLCNSFANQGSIFHWARDHRVHHKHSETRADPHNATRGFFFAHVGWLLLKKDKAVLEAGRELDFSDLLEDGPVRFQKETDPWFTMFVCFFLPGYIVSYGWGDGFWNGFFIAGALRYTLVLHATWCVNSAAHLFGDRPYDFQLWPAENPLVSLCAIGEGWHNWHHKYPYDYAASEYGVSAQFNPTKLFLDACAALGLISGRKRATVAWKLEKEARIGDGAVGPVASWKRGGDLKRRPLGSPDPGIPDEPYDFEREKIELHPDAESTR